MYNNTLYLHIGWSKTGTSAVQAQLNNQFDNLKSRGILYSREMQMNDNAHHHFALAFQSTLGYPAKYSVKEVIEIVDLEMKEHDCHSVIISSELSPFYYNNPRFREWVEKFDNVVVIASVRRQSEVLLSLFNQLIKDPQVRYHGSVLQLTLNNIPRLNYYQNIKRWHKASNNISIKIVNYDDGVVNCFLDYFNLDSISDLKNKITNPSLPTHSLLKIQDATKA